MPEITSNTAHLYGGPAARRNYRVMGWPRYIDVTVMAEEVSAFCDPEPTVMPTVVARYWRVNDYHLGFRYIHEDVYEYQVVRPLAPF